MKRILHLTVKRHWFDLIALGRKKQEFREAKEYWWRRLPFDVGFDEVHIRAGYRKNSPFLRIQYKRKDILYVKGGRSHGYCCRPRNGEILDPTKRYFVISMGEVLKIKNWDGPKYDL